MNWMCYFVWILTGGVYHHPVCLELLPDLKFLVNAATWRRMASIISGIRIGGIPPPMFFTFGLDSETAMLGHLSFVCVCVCV